MAYTTPYYSQFFDAYRAPVSYGYGSRAPVVELIVPMCCTKCHEKVRENMLELRGVQSVRADLQSQRVVVTGFVDPIKALKKARKVKRDATLWTGAAGYGGDQYLSGSKYRRSVYRPSLYRASSYERRPSVYSTSYNQYTPSYGQSTFIHEPQYQPLYESNSYNGGSLYSHVITNPHYVKHVESEYY